MLYVSAGCVRVSLTWINRQATANYKSYRLTSPIHPTDRMSINLDLVSRTPQSNDREHVADNNAIGSHQSLSDGVRNQIGNQRLAAGTGPDFPLPCGLLQIRERHIEALLEGHRRPSTLQGTEASLTLALSAWRSLPDVPPDNPRLSVEEPV